LLGLFFLQAWEDRCRPQPLRLIELGPGRGTLMADMLRVARIRPEFLDAAMIDLIEISPVLREIQKRTLAGYPVKWHAGLRQVPADAPNFIVANEFFDALPVRQFIRAGDHWHERKVTLQEGLFCFVTDCEPAPDAVIPPHLRHAPEAAVFEHCGPAKLLAQEIASRVMRGGGVALIIDYGHLRSGFADTFQAVKSHEFADPLAAPGEADLTCHVDFAALADAARSRGAIIYGPVTQAEFLTALGIRERAAILKRNAMDHAGTIDSGVERLIGDSQMGSLFKVMGISSPATPPLPGFAPC
jgi:NADH dehydrogenase [ubiquinone] 1 alpha subcomplex assembly factor 7